MSNAMKLGKVLSALVLGMSLWCSLASAQITCATGSACKTNFVPVFTSNGGNAQVADSIIQQSASTVVVGGLLSANGFEIGGSSFAFGSASSWNAFLGFAGNSTTSACCNTAVGFDALFGNTTGAFNNAVGDGRFTATHPEATTSLKGLTRFPVTPLGTATPQSALKRV